MGQYYYRCENCDKQIKRHPTIIVGMLCQKCKTQSRIRKCVTCGIKFSPHTVKGKRGEKALYCSLKCSITKESRENLSKKACNNKGGRVEFYKVFNPYLQKEISVQGTYELKYAQYLNKNSLRWNRGKDISLYYQLNETDITKTYYPDFYLIDTNEYVEIKGYFSSENIIKMDAVKKQHPEKQIKILFFEDLKKLNIL